MTQRLPAEQSGLLSVGLVMVDQSVGGTVVRSNVLIGSKLWQDRTCKLFTKLNSPLVKGVNIPDGSLSENLHFVHGNQGSQCARGELLEHEGVGGTVSLKDLVWDKSIDLVGGHFPLQFGTNRLGSLSKGKSLSLSKEVGQQDWVVVRGGANGLSNFVVRFDRRQKVARDHLGTLVDQLIESVLSIGSRFSPNNRSCLHRNLLTVLGNGFSVRLHISLLKVSSKAVHVLIVWQDGNRLGLVKVIVPQTNQTKGEGQVLLGWGVQKVLVNGVSSSVHFHPVLETDGEGNWCSDGRPDRVTSSNPVPESKLAEIDE